MDAASLIMKKLIHLLFLLLPLLAMAQAPPLYIGRSNSFGTNTTIRGNFTVTDGTEKFVTSIGGDTVDFTTLSGTLYYEFDGRVTVPEFVNIGSSTFSSFAAGNLQMLWLDNDGVLHRVANLGAGESIRVNPGATAFEAFTQIDIPLPVSLDNGGTASSLSDPGANRIWGWDDTDNTIGFWTIGSGLSYDHASHTLSASGGTGIPTMDGIGTNTQFYTDSSLVPQKVADMNQGILFSFTAADVQSVDWDGRELVDASGVVSVDWQGRTLKNSSGTTTFNWETFSGTPLGYEGVAVNGDVLVYNGTGWVRSNRIDVAAVIAPVFTNTTAHYFGAAGNPALVSRIVSTATGLAAQNAAGVSTNFTMMNATFDNATMISGALTLRDAGALIFNGRSYLVSDVNSQFLMKNNAQNGFNTLWWFTGSGLSNSVRGLEVVQYPTHNRTNLVVAGLYVNTVSVAVGFTLTGTNSTVIVTADSQTITLPTAVGIAGRSYTVKSLSAAGCTIATTSAQTIDGTTPVALLVGQSRTYEATDGGNWIIKSGY